MPALTSAGKLAVRADRKSGVIRAFFSSMDDSERTEVGTLHIRLADEIPGLFDRWVQMLSEAHCSVVEQVTGMKVAGCEVFRPRDKN